MSRWRVETLLSSLAARVSFFGGGVPVGICAGKPDFFDGL